MDGLLSSLQSSFTVTTHDPLDPASPHPRLSQYKFTRDGFADQEARRKKALAQQGQRRKDFVDYSRRIVEGDLVSDDENDMEEGGFDEVDGCHGDKPSVSRKPPYKNQLMLSEWLLETPEDFEQNWYTIICPIAKRCLVIAAKGNTISYSRSGHRMDSFPSHLPGGCRKLAHHYNNKTYCILDCFYDSMASTYYILDVMCWMGHPVYDSDTEFRNYWLNTKINENDYDLAACTEVNPYKFIPLEYHNSSRPYLTELLSRPYPVQVDGLLFIHKLSHYHLGRTPLALWLKPHMLTDILGLTVSQEFLACAPIMSSDAKIETAKSKQTNPHSKKSSKQMKVDEAMCQED